MLKYENPFENDSVADEVWGQADFSGILCNRGDFHRPTAETLCFHSDTNRLVTNLQSSGVEVDSDGNLWVADSGNHRVLRFSVDADDGEIARIADLVLGQTSFDSAERGSTLDQMYAPSAVRTDSNRWLYVADTATIAFWSSNRHSNRAWKLIQNSVLNCAIQHRWKWTHSVAVSGSTIQGTIWSNCGTGPGRLC